MTEKARFGWESNFPTFSDTSPKIIRGKLQELIRDASSEQINAWDDSIPKLQKEVHEILADYSTKTYEAILEYELPMESRRPDAVLLVRGGVVVLEFKNKGNVTQADIDQTTAYARDLRCYHSICQDVPVYAVVVPTQAKNFYSTGNGYTVLGPEKIDDYVKSIENVKTTVPKAEAFLSETAYRPLPTIVQAARELMQSGKIRAIHRARAATQPAVDAICKIIHEAATTKTRHLILVTGVPGAGKTLVGLQIVHANFIDDLSVPRENGKPTAPAVFLSGNGPLVEVLQYELRSAGGGGKTFVRDVKNYVKRYTSKPSLIPSEHILVFDEAQRAYDAEEVAERHKNSNGLADGKSEPEHFIEFSERIPEWCVVVGLIGGGQEIHIGEEAGIIQWRHAVENSKKKNEWIIHVPKKVEKEFETNSIVVVKKDELDLTKEIRFHLAEDIHNFVSNLLEGGPKDTKNDYAEKMETAGYHLRISRNLEVAKNYLKERYKDNKQARFGILASARDKDLIRFGINNDFQSTKRLKFGPWYGDDENEANGYSCRNLRDCVTEFGAQGLELDAALVAWGTDYFYENGNWTNRNAKKYQNPKRIKDAYKLRQNAYRVLLTRARDVSVVFVPPLGLLDETYNKLCEVGFKPLTA